MRFEGRKSIRYVDDDERDEIESCWNGNYLKTGCYVVHEARTEVAWKSGKVRT